MAADGLLWVRWRCCFLGGFWCPDRSRSSREKPPSCSAYCCVPRKPGRERKSWIFAIQVGLAQFLQNEGGHFSAKENEHFVKSPNNLVALISIASVAVSSIHACSSNDNGADTRTTAAAGASTSTTGSTMSGRGGSSATGGPSTSTSGATGGAAGASGSGTGSSGGRGSGTGGSGGSAGAREVE